MSGTMAKQYDEAAALAQLKRSVAIRMVQPHTQYYGAESVLKAALACTDGDVPAAVQTLSAYCTPDMLQDLVVAARQSNLYGNDNCMTYTRAAELMLEYEGDMEEALEAEKSVVSFASVV